MKSLYDALFVFSHTERSYHEDPSIGLRVMSTVRTSIYLACFHLWTMGHTGSLNRHSDTNICFKSIF